MQRFVSKVANKLDAKGRVSVPALFRQVLDAQQTKGFFCVKALGSSALNGFGEALFAEADDKLKPLHPIFSKDYAAQATAVFAQARYLDLDGEGRVRLPDDFIAHARIEEQVLFVGLDRIFEIWNPAIFEPVEAARLDRMQRAYDTESGS